MTDEDSGDEDDGNIDNMSGNQLRAPCTITATSSRHGRKQLTRENEESDTESENDADTLPSTSAETPRKKSKPSIQRSFKKMDISVQDLSFETPSNSTWIADKDYSLATIFELFFMMT